MSKGLAFHFCMVHGWPCVTVLWVFDLPGWAARVPFILYSPRQVDLAIFHWKTHSLQNEFILAVSSGVSKELWMHATVPAGGSPTSIMGIRIPSGGRAASTEWSSQSLEHRNVRSTSKFLITKWAVSWSVKYFVVLMWFGRRFYEIEVTDKNFI